MKILFFLCFTFALHANTLNPNLLESEKNTISVFGKSVGSVVYISNIQIARGGWIFGETEVKAGTGSGFIWDNEGHIVTNYHVVKDGDIFLISFHKDSKQYKAKLVGIEPKKDTAVLKLTEKPLTLTPVTLGNSSALQVGQKAIAIGNPFGLDHTVTEGIVSALDRKIDTFGGVKIYGMIQTDASINPGNSGGPLLDSSGNVIGMNTMIFSGSGSSAGVGFAVPINTIKQIIPDLIKYGKVIRPELGIAILPEEYNRQFGIKKGVAIASIEPSGPAFRAKLKGMSQDAYGRLYLGDIILKIEENEINSYDEIFHELEKYKVGSEITLTIRRNGKIEKITLALTR